MLSLILYHLPAISWLVLIVPAWVVGGGTSTPMTSLVPSLHLTYSTALSSIRHPPTPTHPYSGISQGPQKRLVLAELDFPYVSRITAIVRRRQEEVRPCIAFSVLTALNRALRI